MTGASSGARRLARAAVALTLSSFPYTALGADNPATRIESATVEVIGVTPVPGLGTPLREVPAAVQSFNADALRRRDALDATEYMERHFAGVSANGAQGNPFQSDLQFRGFTASHLLGLPQGVSVYVDGVRVNEAFGDVVNWDLIPRNAISTSHLLSGANPVFGLNTLGGALSIHTKSGFSYPGHAARILAGAFGRRAFEFESGGHGERADYFVAGNALDERGWRDHSPSSVRQLFAKAGWQDAASDVDLSLALADNALQGIQTLPRSMLANPRLAYTWPDRTANRLEFLTVRGSHYLRDEALLAGVLYYRGLHQDNVSSNVNGDLDPTLPAGAGNPQAFNDRHALAQRMAGASLQLTLEHEWTNARNQLTLGASIDRADSDFAQNRQEALFSADRGTVGFGDFASRTRLRGSNSNLGLYVSEHYTPSEEWTWTIHGRYNVAQVTLQDRSGTQPALNGEHVFKRFNPGLGVTYNPGPAVTWFASAAQGMRVPSPVELTCADPAAPCSLPNQFLADPALKPVIARTLEAGVRARPVERLRVSASAYRSVLKDDIAFISSGSAVNAGFFQNVGRTLRQGVDLVASVALRSMNLHAGYGLVRATYLSTFRVHSPNNSVRDANGDIEVAPGNRLPGIARQNLKLYAEWAAGERRSLGFGWAWFDRQYARGDENNRDASGPLPAYGVAFLTGRFSPANGWEIGLKIDNVFNRRHENFGVLGQNFFTGPGNSFNPAAPVTEQFRSPGAPRAVWLTLRYELTDPQKR
ncbi:MAG: TonB-dependent receptor [Betaproteobacteria bacterium]|nr:TonB-dependent receptor [Betaproteobacteria bacterium]